MYFLFALVYFFSALGYFIPALDYFYTALNIFFVPLSFFSALRLFSSGGLTTKFIFGVLDDVGMLRIS